MRKFKIDKLGSFLATLFLAGSLTVSCSLLAPDDAAITKNIQAKISSDPLLKNSSVEVTTRGRVVTLTGQAPDDSAHLAAYKIATGQRGVKKVDDQINVPLAPPESSAETNPETNHDASSTTPAAPEPASPSQPGAETLPSPSSPQSITVTVPADTRMAVRTIDRINSKTNHGGQSFRASLDTPIVVNDRVVVPAGADANLKLIYAKSAGHMKGRSELALKLSSISFQGKTYRVVSSDVTRVGKSRGKQTAERVGGGAVLGALIGAIAGGGKGAAIGAAAGGGAGTGVQIWTHGQQITIPPETRLNFKLERPLEITYVPGLRSRRHSS